MFTHSSQTPGTNVAVKDVNARLNWYLNENYLEAQRNKLFRNKREEAAVELMKHPISTEKAYAILGLAIGAFPPAAIFTKIFAESMWHGRINDETIVFFFLFFVMNLVCALAGYGMGRLLGKAAFSLERSSWTKMFLIFPLLALAWGIATGVAGGVVFFGIGALIAPFFAISISLVAFPLFAIFHRLLEQGGMIERKQLLPLAFGISFTISAFILGI